MICSRRPVTFYEDKQFARNSLIRIPELIKVRSTDWSAKSLALSSMMHNFRYRIHHQHHHHHHDHRHHHHYIYITSRRDDLSCTKTINEHFQEAVRLRDENVDSTRAVCCSLLHGNNTEHQFDYLKCGCVIVDPATNSVLARASDGSDRHPLHHAGLIVSSLLCLLMMISCSHSHRSLQCD